MNYRQQSGSILIVVLAYLTIIALLAMSVAEISLLEMKISDNFTQQMLAVQLADNILARAETNLQTKPFNESGPDYQIQRLTLSHCMQSYLITVKDKTQFTAVALASRWDNYTSCRQNSASFWRQIWWRES